MARFLLLRRVKVKFYMILKRNYNKINKNKKVWMPNNFLGV